MKCFLFLATLLVTCSLYAQQRPEIFEVPGKNEYAVVREDGISVLPSGRYVKPAGKFVRISHDPFGMAISQDGKTIVTIHDGVFTIINTDDLSATRVPSYDKTIPSPLRRRSFLGVAFGADSKTIYLSGGDDGSVIIYDIRSHKRLDSISLNGSIHGTDYGDSFTSDLVALDDHHILALDRGNFRLVKIDIRQRKVVASVKVGRQPFGLAVSPDKKQAFVANVGMYEYPLVKGATPANADSMMISGHPYGNGSREAIEGTIKEGKEIPGVGSPLHEDAMSVFTVDLGDFIVSKKIKTGYQVGEMVEDAEVVGGSSPNSIVVGKTFAYVSNASNDLITVIDRVKGEIVANIPIILDPSLARYRGLIPFGLCLSKDEKTLYAALLGGNAIAVVDIQSRKQKGFIPAGWGPTRVLLSPDQKSLYVASCRGLGAGPNGGKGFVAPKQGTYIGDIQLGMVQKIPVPGNDQLSSFTAEVKKYTYRKSTVNDQTGKIVPAYPGAFQSPIKHIVYITKENRTFDEVLGQMPNAVTDTTLARFGNHVEVIKGRASDISPNHIKIASEFAFSDNFYCDSDASIHGHHWMMGVIPNEWVEANSSVDKTAKLFSSAPGRRFPGSTGSMDPEDYAEIGGLWEALERKGIEFYNFGEANETAHVREEWYDTATGAGHIVMVPMQKALYPRTSHNYAGYNTNIPDQFRVEQFETEFTKLWLNGKDEMPPLVTIQLPNDHTASPRPNDGYPFMHSYMADNDLALGRMLQFLSGTPYWKDMLVIITEDDPQGGVDHVDAHRSLLMLAGPFVKRGQVSHLHGNFGSILKLIYNILGVPYVNQYDVTASFLDDLFTDKPDNSPYKMVFPDPMIFDADKAMKKYDRTIDWRKLKKGPEMDDAREIRSSHYQER